MNKDQVNFINDDNPDATDYNYLNYDVWRIDTHQISNKWFIDNVAASDFIGGCEYPYYIVCFGFIPSYALKLVDLKKPYQLTYKKRGSSPCNASLFVMCYLMAYALKNF